MNKQKLFHGVETTVSVMCKTKNNAIYYSNTL